MIWRILARVVAVAHTSYTIFVVFGSLLVLLWRPLLWLHVAAVLWAGLTLMFDLGCPLTPWEKRFWRRGGVEPYDEGFLQHHVLHTRFDPARSRRIHATLGGAAITLNAVIYYLILSR